jgi:hypothetical protein
LNDEVDDVQQILSIDNDPIENNTKRDEIPEEAKVIPFRV